jgi:ribonuclease BN (tRNA processing enzyme)
MSISIERRALLTSAAMVAASGIILPAIPAAQPGRPRTRLILLGTGAGPQPKAARAAAASALVIDDAIYVIDCGDGVARQLVLAGLKLRNVRNIFITHHHSDHTAGYGNLLQLGWASGMSGPVETYGPPPLDRMTRLFFDMIRPEMEIRIQEGRKAFEHDIHTHEIQAAGVVHQDERTKVTAALVHHPLVAPALAYRFDTAERSIVFSGDTSPSENLVRLAEGADILVHEVIYLPLQELEFRANPSRDVARAMQHTRESHTSLEEVGKIASAAKVKTLVLSHIGPDHPDLTDEILRAGAAQNFSGQVIVGRDLLEL